MTDKINKLGCVLFLVTSLWGCAENERTADFVSIPEAIPLTSRIVVTQVDALVPRAMFVVDGKLGIYKEREENMLDFYSLLISNSSVAPPPEVRDRMI